MIAGTLALGTKSMEPKLPWPSNARTCRLAHPWILHFFHYVIPVLLLVKVFFINCPHPDLCGLYINHIRKQGHTYSNTNQKRCWTNFAKATEIFIYTDRLYGVLTNYMPRCGPGASNTPKMLEIPYRKALDHLHANEIEKSSLLFVDESVRIVLDGLLCLDSATCVLTGIDSGALIAL